MTATLKLVSSRVGEAGLHKGTSVRRVQELLLAAGESLPKFGADGSWGDEAVDALESFQKRHKDLPARRYLLPNDVALLVMAAEADVLIQLPGKTGFAGIEMLHRTFKAMNVKYNEGAQHGAGNRAIYGVEGNPQWAIQTFYDKVKGPVIKKGPVEMDCTTYVNLMLSVYLFGNAHNHKYDASCKDFGWESSKHLARDRYNPHFPLISRKEGGKELNYFDDAEQIEAATRGKPDALYVMEAAGARWDKNKGKKVYGVVTHMGLLHRSRVFECTTGQLACSACIDRSLAEFMANKGIIYLFGPG